VADERIQPVPGATPPQKPSVPTVVPAPRPGSPIGLIFWTFFDFVIILATTAIACTICSLLMYDDAEYCTYRWMQAIGIQPNYVGLGDRQEKAANRYRYRDYLECTELPSDDVQLEAWLAEQPDLLEPSVRRYPEYIEDTRITQVQVSYSGDKGRSTLPIPWERFGYKAHPKSTYWVHVSATPEFSYLPSDAEFRLFTLAWMQLGLLFAGLFRVFRNRKLALPSTTGKAPWNDFWGILLGIVIGLLGGGIYWLYEQALMHWGGASLHGWSAWRTMVAVGWNGPQDYAPAGWNNVKPHHGVIAALFITCVGGAVVQEIYFRNGLLKMWSARGYAGMGLILSSFLGSLIFLDVTYLPVSLAMAFVLGWLYQRTQSLTGPLLAHVISYALVLCIIFGAIPSLPHPAIVLPGEWSPQPTKVDEATVVWPTYGLTFDRGGGIEKNHLTHKDPVPDIFVIRPTTREYPRRYEWISRDTIRIRYQKDTYISNSRVLHIEVMHQDFRVSVDKHELILTPVDGEGKAVPLRYRRYFP